MKRHRQTQMLKFVNVITVQHWGQRGATTENECAFVCVCQAGQFGWAVNCETLSHNQYPHLTEENQMINFLGIRSRRFKYNRSRNRTSIAP